jgi:HD-GYP domain-containing protein (c-di-GMP phosphodiesterase class II)
VTLLLALSRAIEARDPYSSGHGARVTAIAESVAARLGWHGERIDVLRMGAALHDIGKLTVSTDVLGKPGPLSSDELSDIRRHPETGARMVQLIPRLRPAVPGVRHHHERWDGRGYPDGCAGRSIPAEARILAVADAFDAMTSDRPYRPALSPERALAELRRCAGAQFDPEVVGALVEAWSEGEVACSAELRAAS